jgi:hypothetical protein
MLGIIHQAAKATVALATSNAATGAERALQRVVRAAPQRPINYAV